MSATRLQLLNSATALCNDFASSAPLDQILSHFSSTHLVTAREHGLPFLAPFLGRTFSGIRGPNSVETYFNLLKKHLTYENMSFTEWVVDPESRKVSCRGQARFKWLDEDIALIFPRTGLLIRHYGDFDRRGRCYLSSPVQSETGPNPS